MKKAIFISVIFIFITVLTFNSLFYQDKYLQYNQMINAGQTDSGCKIVISTGNKKTEEVYSILKNYLNKYNGNLYCANISNESGKSIYAKYVYITNPYVFKDINLSKGRFFTLHENESEKFLSTENTGNVNQIGQIEDFAGDYHYEIRTLKSKLDTNLFDRNFFLQLNNKQDIDKFINELNKEDIYILKASEAPNGGSSNSLFKLIIAVGFLILILLVFYDILNSYKKIAIEKMLGFRKISIWAKRVMPIIVEEILVMSLTTSLLIVVNFKVFNHCFLNFLLKLVEIYGLMTLLTIVLVSIPFLYVKRINISNMLKNKRPVKAIVFFNTCIKISLVVVFLVLSINAFTQFQMISSRYKTSYGKWENTKNYAIIPSIEGTVDTNQDYYTESNKQKEKELYFYFNKNGSIYANFQEFLPGDREENLKNLKVGYKCDFVTVNPNYLITNSIYDEDGKRIDIAETDSDYVLLVPENYHSYEKEIREYYQFVKNGYNHIEEENNSKNNIKKTLSIVVNQKIKIIWTKMNQSYFSYRLDVNPQNNNCVINPIVRVLTESNGDSIDYFKILGYKGNPFKIKVNDPSNPSASILPKIREYYDSTKYKFPVSLVYDNVEDQIQNVKQQLQFSIMIMVVLCIIISTIILQNIINYFEQNKSRLAIQQFHGYKKLDKYKNYFLMLGFSWIIILNISFLMIKRHEILILIPSLMLIECIISLVLLSFAERIKILKVAKGG